MFKEKLKSMNIEQGFIDQNFEIISDNEASALTGGCGNLKRCGQYTGSCTILGSCGTYAKVFKNKTVLIIAHRLSTVKKSDNIIVLKNGRVAEQGNHKELVAQKKEYYNLIKNQLELDN